MNPKIRSIELPGRVRLDYAEHGDPAGVPVIALHGVSDSWRSFERLLPHLPHSLRLLAPSQRGHGDSERPAAGYRPRDFADDVAAFMDALGIGRAILVGHSMGSTHALRFAALHPQRTLGLLLVGATASFGANPDTVAFWRGTIAALEDPVPADFVRDFQCSTFSLPMPAAFLDLVVAESLKLPARVWRAAFDGFMSEDALAELRSIASPTLIVWGRHDGICRLADQQALLSIPRSRLVVYERCGHTPHWEEPERFARELSDFALAAADAATAAA